MLQARVACSRSLLCSTAPEHNTDGTFVASKTCQKMCAILTLHSTHSQTHPLSLLNPFGFSVHPLPPSSEHLFSRVSRRRAELCATIC